MADLKNLEKVNEHVQKTLTWFSDELLKIQGDQILSVSVYGSAIDNDFCPKRSNINIVVIFKSLEIHILEKILPLVKKAAKKRIVAPLCFTEEHIKTSQDTFPIEFLEIQARHVCVYGVDPFETLAVDRANLRMQCEQQVKSLLINLRQSYLEIGLAKKGIENLIVESFRAVLPVFRTVLRLKGEALPQDREQLILQVSSLAGLSASIFMMVLKNKTGDEKIGTHQAVDFLGNYLSEINKLACFVDEM
jgi:hypothetical protein